MCTSNYYLTLKHKQYINAIKGINEKIIKFCGEDIANIINTQIIDYIEYYYTKNNKPEIEIYLKLGYKLKIECNSGYRYFKLIDTNAPNVYIYKSGYKSNSEMIYRCSINDKTITYKNLHTT